MYFIPYDDITPIPKMRAGIVRVVAILKIFFDGGIGTDYAALREGEFPIINCDFMLV